MNAEILVDIIVGFISLVIIPSGGYFIAMVISDIKEITREQAALALKISEQYATKSDLNSARLETSESLKRVYDKIDSLDEKIDSHMGEVQSDIKKLLARAV
jgi:predicted DNA-binding protein (UPF0251 family)